MMLNDDYLARVMNHLSNTQFYEKIIEDHMEQFLEEVTSSLAKIVERQTQDRDTFDFL